MFSKIIFEFLKSFQIKTYMKIRTAASINKSVKLPKNLQRIKITRIKKNHELQSRTIITIWYIKSTA